MKKINFALKNIAVLIILISSFIACDKDFASIDSDIVNSGNATHFDTDNNSYTVITYNKKLNPVQTNNLPINMLGIYKDPLYGLTTASFVTQLNMPFLDPDFGEGTELDSVVLTVPFFSRAVDVNEDGNTVYELDSILGDGFMNLSIYENNFFLRDFDPNSEFSTPQLYYSNGSTSEADFIDSSQLEGELLEQITTNFNLEPNSNPIGLKDTEGEITQVLTPSLRIKLDNDFWQEKIIDMEGEPELSNQNNFNDYLRGIYFKVDGIDGNGKMMLLNFLAANANITLYYTKDPFTEGDDRDESSFKMNFTGNRINFFNNEYIIPLQDGNAVDGDEKLFLKGGEGSMAVINLFDGDEDGNSTELDDLKTNNWLINEANLVFYVDQTMVQGEEEPERIFLYDLENNTPLIDYYLDLGNNTFPVISRINHLGRLERVDSDDPESDGVKYKIRITQHINNIISNDSTNVKLGLAISGNINIESNTPHYGLLTESEEFDKVPSSSIISPRGTVLYGNNTLNEEKKVYLEIFYTEPNN